MADAIDLQALDGHAQAELVRSGEMSARELVAASIARIDALDGPVNAVASTRFDQALAEADGLRPGADVGPLAGVPFLVKDLGPPCAGTETTVGSAFLSGFVADHDGELVRRYRQAGLVVVGKSRTAEFGVLPTTEPAHGGPTRNPCDLSRSVGGSSGGAAAAVALGLVPLAHANDAGGSIRIPAACCGAFGLKPTRARTPLGPDLGDLMNGLAVEHVISRSVRDSAAALDLTAGPDVGDPYWAPPAPGSFRRAVADGPRRPLRVAVAPSGPPGGPVHPECRAAVADAARLCAELGHEVDEAAPPVAFAEVADLFLLVWAAGVSSAISAYAGLSGRTPEPDLFEPLTWSLYQRGRQVSAADYLVTVTRLQQVARRLAAFHESWDVVLSPVTAEPAPPLGAFAGGTPDEQMARAVAFVHDAPLANLTGQPAMSVPLHRDAAGVPVGVQFAGRFGDEAGLLALAGQLETARPWCPVPAAASRP